MVWKKIIDSRMDTSSIGFNSDVKSKTELNVGEAFKHALPQDFVKFGLIPEFIGRVPITVSLEALDRDALIRILKEPKNSLIKQYTKLFELDGVGLEFTDDAVNAIADKHLRERQGPEDFVPSWRLLCLTLCIVYRQTRASADV